MFSKVVMRNFIGLLMDPSRIRKNEWRRFYRQVRRLWLDSGDGLLCVQVQRRDGEEERLTYSPLLESLNPEGQGLSLQVCGNASPLRVADRFLLHEDLRCYRARLDMDLPEGQPLRPTRVRCATRMATLEPRSPCLLRDDDRDSLASQGKVWVFAGQTQGFPYQLPVMAAAMLAEICFPDAARVWSTLEVPTSEAALDRLESVLNLDSVSLDSFRRQLKEPVPLATTGSLVAVRSLRVSAPCRLPEEVPAVSVSAQRVLPFRRVAVMYEFLGADADHSSAMDTFLDIAGWSSDTLTLLRSRLKDAALQEALARALDREGEETGWTRWTCFSQCWWEATADIDTLIHLFCRHPQGPRLAPETWTQLLVSTGISLDFTPIVGLEALGMLDVLTSRAMPEEAEAGTGQMESLAAFLAALPPSRYMDPLLLQSMRWMGQNPALRLGQAPILAWIRQKFPDGADRCQEILVQETARLKRNLQEAGSWALALQRQGREGSPEARTGVAWADYQTGQTLAPAQRQWLQALGTLLAARWSTWQRDLTQFSSLTTPVVADLDSAAACRERRQWLAFASVRLQIPLTGQAWQWIDAEENTAHLDVVLFLMGLETAAPLVEELRQVVCEHRELCMLVYEAVVHSSQWGIQSSLARSVPHLSWMHEPLSDLATESASVAGGRLLIH
jgi:hypothetical protein